LESVTPAGAAGRAGLQTGDVILEIQGKAAGQDSQQELARLSPGDTITLKVRTRHGAEQELQWKMAGRQEVSYDLKDLEHVTPQQRARRTAWLKGEAETPGAVNP